MLGTWTNSSLHHASQLDIVLMCADYLAAISGVDEALTRASDFIDLRLKLGSCQRSEIVQHVYCISSHWTRVAESSWDVDRAVRACIETTRSIALVGNSSVACREAAHQLKLGQYLVTTIGQLACHEVAGTLNKHNVQTCTNLPVAPSLAFTDCTPTEGLTLACPINDVQIPIAYSRPLCSAYNKAIVDLFNRFNNLGPSADTFAA